MAKHTLQNRKDINVLFSLRSIHRCSRRSSVQLFMHAQQKCEKFAREEIKRATNKFSWDAIVVNVILEPNSFV